MKKLIFAISLLLISVNAFAYDYAIRWATNTPIRVVTPVSADATYLHLNGDNANTDINIGAYDLTATTLYATGAGASEIGSLKVSDLTSGRIPIVSTDGLLIDDSSLLYDATNNSLTVNLNSGTPGSNLTGTAISARGADNGTVRVATSSYGIAGMAGFANRHARGTMASPSAVQSTDTLFSLEGWGYGATGYSASPRAFIRGYAGGTWTDADQDAYMSFWTTPDSVIVPVRQWSLLANGNLVSALDGTGTQNIITAGTTNSFGDLKIPAMTLNTPTYSTIKDFANSFGGCGRKTGGVITDATGGYVAVTAGTGFIKATDDDNAQLLFFNWSAPSNIAIPDGTTRYIGVEYNSGNPQVVARTTYNWNLDSEFPLGTVISEFINTGYELYVYNIPWWVTDGNTNLMEVVRSLGLVRRDEAQGGLIISQTGTRNVAVSAGTVWSGVTEFNFSGIDTATSGTFEQYWYKAGTGWQSSDVTQYSVTQWNDVTQTALQNIDANKFCNIWIYGESNAGTVYPAIIMPQAQYNTAAAAEAVKAPSNIPVHISNAGLLLGRIIIKQGTDAPVMVESAFGTVFSASVVTDHGNLSGLTDDDHTQYSLSAGDTYTGVHDFGGATSLEVPNAAGDVTCDASGEIAVDTTNKQLGVYEGANEVAIPLRHIFQGTIDLSGAYDVDSDVWLWDLDSTTYPNGVYITAVYLDSSVADPTTEINANLMYCDAVADGAFPGANATLIKAIDTTTGNFADAAVNTTVAAGKTIYIDLDADPTDSNVVYHLKIYYRIPENS